MKEKQQKRISAWKILVLKTLKLSQTDIALGQYWPITDESVLTYMFSTVNRYQKFGFKELFAETDGGIYVKFTVTVTI